MLGVSRQRVAQLARAHADFPAPEAELASGRIWRSEAIASWLAHHPERSPGRPTGEPLPFDRLNEEVKRLLVAAQKEAAAVAHTEAGGEHVVVAMVAGRRPEPELAGLTARRARAALQRLARPGPGPARGRRPLSQEVVRALRRAAAGAGSEHIGARQLLSCLLEESAGGAGRLLSAAGVDPAGLRRALDAGGQDRVGRALEAVAEQLGALVRRLDALERAAGQRPEAD